MQSNMTEILKLLSETDFPLCIQAHRRRCNVFINAEGEHSEDSHTHWQLVNILSLRIQYSSFTSNGGKPVNIRENLFDKLGL